MSTLPRAAPSKFLLLQDRLRRLLGSRTPRGAAGRHSEDDSGRHGDRRRRPVVVPLMPLVFFVDSSPASRRTTPLPPGSGTTAADSLLFSRRNGWGTRSYLALASSHVDDGMVEEQTHGGCEIPKKQLPVQHANVRQRISNLTGSGFHVSHACALELERGVAHVDPIPVANLLVALQKH
jgi:hypothetical protein